MYLTGHVASSLLVAAGVARVRGMRTRLRTVLLPAVLGGVTPDLLDKAILALGASRYGRTVGHSLLFLVMGLVVWAVLCDRSSRRASRPAGFWVLGVATHLLVDLADDAVRGLIAGGQAVYSFFLWPLASPYDWMLRNPNPMGVWPWTVTPLEVAVLAGLVVWLVWLAVRGRRKPPARGQIPRWGSFS